MSQVFLFHIVLVGGILLSLSSDSLLLVWVGLELSSICFIALLSQNRSISEMVGCYSYFLFQEVGSYFFLVGGLGGWGAFSDLGLIVKLGGAPFHIWMLIAVQSVSWVNCFLLLVAQKLAPLFLLGHTGGVYWCGLASVVVGAIGMVGQSSVRQILAYSSVNQTGWMLIIAYLSINILKIYFMIYFIIMVLSLLFLHQSIVYEKSGEGSWGVGLVGVSLFLVSLSGFPPLVGFLFKWGGVTEFIGGGDFLISGCVMVASVFSTYVYFSLGYKILVFSKLFGFTSSGLVAGLFLVGVGFPPSYFLWGCL
uniref:NADH-ubiquinone oxidoreductase chain 2 n=1 Tax=Terebratalia transversa TaxID=34513 RepID=Q953W7_TERTR|nr:NADH dehydrogenase subunit 2 [Terebratalia transversa]AAK95509.1 NADH dehydrogenase subunit 2 [Terebratalia transversa]